MKYILLIAFAIVVLTACKKEYTCNCPATITSDIYYGTFSNPAHSVSFDTVDVSFSTGVVKKQEAKAICSDASGSSHVTQFGCSCDSYTLGSCVMLE